MTIPDHKFKIGDIVQHVAGGREAERYVVVELCSQTCVGGTQLSYIASGCDRLGLRDSFGPRRANFSETELVLVEPAK